MRQIASMIACMKSREKYFLMFSYIANVMVTSILIMIATGIKNITNESLSSSDMQQVQNIFTSVIAVSIIAIAFFQWIISMQFRALFDSRKQFNNNMRLMGSPDKGLLKIYMKEMIKMQPISVFVGALLGEIVFRLLAEKLDTSIKYITSTQILIAIVIHLIVITFCVMFTFRKLTRNNVIDEIRGINTLNEKKKNNLWNIVKSVIGVAMLLVSVFAALTGEQGSDQQAYGWFGILIAIFLIYDLLVLFVHKMISKIAINTRNRLFIFSEAISIAYLNKSKAYGTMILFSSMMFLGLNMLYTNVRFCGLDTVDARVHYAGSVWFDEIQNDMQEDSQIEKGLRFKTKKSGSVWYIWGVDASFEGSYEDIVLDKKYGANQEQMREQLDQPDFDGIYMPNMFISKDDVGNEITININDRDVTFHIAGAYYSNNLSHISFFVSKSYLAKALGLEEQDYNVLYFANKEKWDLFETTKPCVFQPFEDIREESYEKAVTGTSLVEMVAAVIILCAVISLVNFIMISSKGDSYDIARLRGIGLAQNEVRKIYVIESLVPVIISMIISIPASILFAKIGCNMVFDAGYYQRGLVIIPMQMLGLLVLFSVISLVIRITALRKVMTSDSYVGILREVKE